VLDKSINYEHLIKKSTNVDFKYFENLVELQSIELACFVLSVCNVVLVVEDWFTDPALFRFA
jgi:protein SMG9